MCKVNQKTRISRIEAKVPKIINGAKIKGIYMYGCWPSIEEKKKAINKLKEINHSSSGGKITFIPYIFLQDFQCYFPKISNNIKWDGDLGVDTVNNSVYMLLEKYDKKWAFTKSNIQPAIVDTLEE